MSTPKNQHYIPKSYLRNFAQPSKGQLYLEAFDLKVESLINKINIKNICVEKDFYTFTKEEIKDYSLEEFYGNNVDSTFPEVHEILTNPKRKYINSKERHNIISTILSLYFRTPKFIAHMNEITNQAFDFAIAHADKKSGKARLDFEGELIEFHIDEIKEVKAEYAEKNRLVFLSIHLRKWKEFVQFKVNDGIMVYTPTSQINFISGDNPVSIYSGDNRFYLFDPNNTIRVPLDPSTSLFIGPKTDTIKKDEVFRQISDTPEVLTSNYIMPP